MVDIQLVKLQFTTGQLKYHRSPSTDVWSGYNCDGYPCKEMDNMLDISNECKQTQIVKAYRIQGGLNAKFPSIRIQRLTAKLLSILKQTATKCIKKR